MSAAKRVPIASRAMLEERLERERLRIHAAEGICRVAAIAASAFEDGLHEMTPERMEAIHATFRGLAEQLDRIKDAISPEEMLAPATEEEIEGVQS